MTREKKAFYNVVSNILLQCVLAISGFVIPKLILAAYGSTMNGLINSISQFLTYAGLVEMGVANAAIVVLYKPIVEKNNKRISEIATTVKRKYLLSGTLYTLIVAGVALLYPFIVKDQLDYWFVFSMVLIIAGVSIIDYFIIGKYKVILLANQQYFVVNFVRAAATIFLIVGSCWMLITLQPLYLVKLLAVVIHLFEAIVIKIYVNRTYPEVKFNCLPEENVIPQQANALIHQITTVIVYNTDLVVLTLFLTGESLKEVSVYTVYALAFGMVNNLMSSFTTSFDATFGDMTARKQKDAIKKFFNGYEYWFLILLYAVYSCFIVLIVPFVRCYTKGIVDINYIRPEVGILFGLNGIFALIKEPAVVIVRANGSFKQTQNLAIMEAVINIVISIVLVRQWGIVGVLIGTIISHAVVDVGFIMYSNKQLIERRNWLSVKNNLINAVVLVVLLLIEFKLVYDISGWLKWILAGGVLFVINMTVYILINYMINPENFEFGKNYVMSKLRKDR